MKELFGFDSLARDANDGDDAAIEETPDATDVEEADIMREMFGKEIDPEFEAGIDAENAAEEADDIYANKLSPDDVENDDILAELGNIGG